LTTVPPEDYDILIHCCNVQSTQADEGDVRSTIWKTKFLAHIQQAITSDDKGKREMKIPHLFPS